MAKWKKLNPVRLQLIGNAAHVVQRWEAKTTIAPIAAQKWTGVLPVANMRKYGMTRACVPNRDADKRRRNKAFLSRERKNVKSDTKIKGGM